MVVIIYDRQCPLCSAYIKYYRIYNAAGDVRLIDARANSKERDEITARGWDLDKGMVVIIGDSFYYGSDAIHALAMISTRHGWFNRINFLLFRSPLLAKILYPLCKAGRRLALYIRGIPGIHNLPTG